MSETHADSHELAVVAATAVEARALRRALPGERVVLAGIRAALLTGTRFDAAIVCGLAGGLRSGVPAGTVVVASEIVREDGTREATDRELTEMLVAGARRVGCEPLLAPVLASAQLVTGEARGRWAQRGCAAAEMESDAIAARRLAVVRVVLDTPEREISGEWLRPLRAIARPRLWGEMLWLARAAPRYARAAADVVRAALHPS